MCYGFCPTVNLALPPNSPTMHIYCQGLLQCLGRMDQCQRSSSWSALPEQRGNHCLSPLPHFACVNHSSFKINWLMDTSNFGGGLVIARAWFFSEVTNRAWRSWVWLRGGHLECFLLWWDACLKTCSIKFLQIGELQRSIYRDCELLLLWPQTCRAWLKFCQSHAHKLKLKIDFLSLLSAQLPDTPHRINYLHAL